MVRKAWMIFPALIILAAPCLRAQDESSEVALFKELTEAPGPSGYEGPVRKIFEAKMRALGADVSTDGLGSVIAVVRGTSERPRIMVDAHLDELGAMVRTITPEGFIRIQPLGWWLGPSLLNQRWVIYTSKGPVAAVSGQQDAHIATPEQTEWATKPENIFLDVGAKSREDAERLGIRPGDPIAPSSPFTELANHRFAAKAWDDRIGLAMIIEALTQMKQKDIKLPCTVYFAGTVQEEFGMRGSMTASKVIQPDLGIAIEVGIAADYPGPTPAEAEETLGAGPGIFLFDNSMVPNLNLRDFFFQVAKEKDIPLQTDLVYGYGQDAAEMQRYGTGTPAINFVVPTRYTHTHTGVIDQSDFDRGVELLIAVLERLDETTVKRIAAFQ